MDRVAEGHGEGEGAGGGSPLLPGNTVCRDIAIASVVLYMNTSRE